jgi:uncharacterized tellurite resistance protein B-like protein
MFDAIKRLLAGSPPASGGAGSESEEDRVRIAACALLLEIAHSDGQFTDDERRQIEEAVSRHFALTPDQARHLMAVAAERRREATDLHQFTSVLTSHYDEGQRMTLAEVLYRVVYADGLLSEHEDYLMHKLAGLLELRPGYLNAARTRVVPKPGNR